MALGCYEPSTGGVIEESVELCEGEYELDDGLKIEADNLLVECQDTVLKGYFNEEGFAIINRENVTISGCDVKNFQAGARITNSDNVKITKNTFENNNVGLYFTNSQRVVIEENEVDNSTVQGVYLDNESRANTFRDNVFRLSDFNVNAEEAPDNNYTNNEYIDSEGPGEHITDYLIETEEPQSNESAKENKSEVIIPEESEPADVINRVYEAKELDSADYLEGDLEKIQETTDKVEVKSEIRVDYENNKTTYNTSYKAKEDVKNMQVFEYIPKSIANSVDELNIQGDYQVLEEDPLIMWEYEELEAGEEEETSYEVNKAVKEEKPENAVCVDCAKKKKSYSFLIPLLLIPIIVFGFILFERMQRPL